MTDSISQPIPQTAADAALDESIQFADEVVTHALLRTAELPLGAGTAAIITLDNGFDHSKPNTFGPGGLLELKAALTEAQAIPGVAAICVTGKPFIFAVGADLTGVPRRTDRGQAAAVRRLLRRLSAELWYPQRMAGRGARGR